MPFSRAPKSQQNVNTHLESSLEDMAPEEFGDLKNGTYTVNMTAPDGAAAEIRLTLSTPNQKLREATFDLVAIDWEVRDKAWNGAEFLDNPLAPTWNRGRSQVTFTFPKGEESTRLFEAVQLLCGN